MKREDYVDLYGEYGVETLWSIDEIRKWRRKVEAFSGHECINLEQLPSDANVYDWNHAKAEDCNWFMGYINDLSIMVS